jgi:hypothetical protein
MPCVIVVHVSHTPGVAHLGCTLCMPVAIVVHALSVLLLMFAYHW